MAFSRGRLTAFSGAGSTAVAVRLVKRMGEASITLDTVQRQLEEQLE
jgi:predicted kinase